MAVAKMMLLNIEFTQQQYDDVLFKLLEQKNFHPEPASKIADSVQGLSVLNRENPYADLLSRMKETSEKYHFPLEEVAVEKNVMNVIKEDEFFCNLIEQAEAIMRVKKEIDIVIEENKDAIIQLKHVAGINVNFDDLFSCQYLKVRFGRLPLDNVEKLNYYEGHPFIFKRFEDDQQYTWCMYITTPNKVMEIDNIFSSLYFERIQIPNFIHGTSDLAIQEIEEETEVGTNISKDLQNRIDHLFLDEKDHLNQIYSIALHLNKTFQAEKYVIVLGEKSVVYGFAEEKDASKIKEDFESIKGVSVLVKPGDGDSRLTPPTKLKNNWFCQPFKMFVEMYGVPGYKDSDPTAFVALTYTLLFGIMFGDVGQGLLLSLVGYIAYKKFHMQLGAVGVRLGFSSAIFGFVFGSIFGDEEILKPIIAPMDSNSTMTLLLGAVGIGVILIMVTILMNTIKNFKQKHLAEALFSQNGLSGLVFYTGVLGYALNMVAGLHFANTLYVIICIVIPILLIFFKEPLELKMEGKAMFPDGFMGFFMQSFFECFEVILTFIANTMSYLRVGGFILSHAGMMMVVYTLANMFGHGSMGYFIVLVIGNIFVMCLEGLIVGIQVLRLEFYEMFSRYYEGNGVAFKTIED